MCCCLVLYKLFRVRYSSSSSGLKTLLSISRSLSKEYGWANNVCFKFYFLTVQYYYITTHKNSCTLNNICKLELKYIAA